MYSLYLILIIFIVPSKRLELLHYYYFMSASKADVSTKFHQEGISTPEEIRTLNLYFKPWLLRSVCIPIPPQEYIVGVKGLEPIVFLMCQIYSLVPIHHLSSTPINYYPLQHQRNYIPTGIVPVGTQA